MMGSPGQEGKVTAERELQPHAYFPAPLME